MKSTSCWREETKSAQLKSNHPDTKRTHRGMLFRKSFPIKSFINIWFIQRIWEKTRISFVCQSTWFPFYNQKMSQKARWLSGFFSAEYGVKTSSRKRAEAYLRELPSLSEFFSGSALSRQAKRKVLTD